MARELVGRAQEIAAGRRFLAALQAGPATLTIEGEPGIGKTALLNAIVDESGAAATLTLRSRPAEPEMDLSLASLGDLLAPIADEVRPALPDPQRRALDTALVLADPEPSAPSSDPRAVGAMLLTALRFLAASRPVVVAIDDAQWVDAASARAIEFAARRLSDERIGLLVAVRRGEAAAFDVSHAPASGSSETVALGPMSLGALHRLIESRTGVSLSRPTLIRLERASRGIPLFALDMVNATMRSGTPITPDTILTAPLEIDRIVEPRLLALPEATRRLVIAGAALGRPTLELLGQVARRRDARPLLAPATEAGLIEIDGQRVRFVHPLYQSAVYLAETPEGRRALHRRLASVVSDPVESAHHLALSADEPDAVVAASVTAAANDAQARGALETASSLLEQAIRLWPPDRGERLDVVLALARCCWELGDIDRSLTLADEVLEGDPPDEARAAALVLRGMHVLWRRGATEALPVYEEALRCSSDDPVLEATIHLRVAYAADNDLSLAARHAAAAAAILDDQAGADDLVACALLMSAEQQLMAGRGYEAAVVERGRAILARPSMPADGRVVFDARAVARERSWLLRAATDELAVARDELDDIRRHDADRGLDRAAPIALMDLAELSCLVGAPGEARAYAAEAVSIAAQTGRLPYADAASRFSEALVAEHVGDLAEAARIASQVHDIAGGLGPSPLSDRCDIALARIDLARMRPTVAARKFREVAERLDRSGVRWPAALRFRGDFIEALVRAGLTREAQEETSRLEAGATIAPTPWSLAIAARSRALLAAADSDLVAAVEELERALDWLDRVRIPVELGRTHLIMGRVLRRLRKRTASAEAFGSAVAAFAGAGASRWEADARRELQRIGDRGMRPNALSATEHEIARLAATGMTNRQVADAMVLSPKTIDGALTRVYAKLGIHTRAELGTWAAVAAVDKEG